MPANERRSTRRFIMRVPLRFRPMKQASIPEESAASMNISTHGVYFATATKVSEGVLVQVHLKMPREIDRKSTRLNSSHGYISYAVFCLKKKKQHNKI